MGIGKQISGKYKVQNSPKYIYGNLVYNKDSFSTYWTKDGLNNQSWDK